MLKIKACVLLLWRRSSLHSPIRAVCVWARVHVPHSKQKMHLYREFESIIEMRRKALSSVLTLLKCICTADHEGRNKVHTS